MVAQTPQKPESNSIHQPLSPEQVPAAQHAENRQAQRDRDLTINPGDVAHDDKSLAEKAQQVAVNVPDMTVEQVVIPTYFIVEQPNGDREALHHVRDAEAISDVIRQARMDDNGNRTWW